MSKFKKALRVCVFQLGVNILGFPIYRAHIIQDFDNKLKRSVTVKQFDY